MSTNGNSRIAAPASPGLFFTGDVYSGGSVLGIERRYTIPEVIDLSATGIFSSTVKPASGVRLVVVGVMFDWVDQLKDQISATFQVTLAGSDLLGTTDTPLGSFTAATPSLHLPIDALPGNSSAVDGQAINLVTSEGDGANPLFQFGVVNPGNDTFKGTVYYAPLYASNPC